MEAYQEFLRDVEEARGLLATPLHGSRSTYTNLGCRCAKCREAESAYTRTYRNITKTRFEALKKSSLNPLALLRTNAKP